MSDALKLAIAAIEKSDKYLPHCYAGIHNENRIALEALRAALAAPQPAAPQGGPVGDAAINNVIDASDNHAEACMHGDASEVADAREGFLTALNCLVAVLDAPAPVQATPAGWVSEHQSEPLEGSMRIQDSNGRFIYVGSNCLDITERMLFDLASHVISAHQPAAPAPAQAVPLTDAARDVLAERQRQISAEGWTPKHDDTHSNGSMALAAACYACNAATWAERASTIPASDYTKFANPGFHWPWAQKWWKPKSQRQDLVRAGALILAELERIDRAHGINQPGSEAC